MSAPATRELAELTGPQAAATLTANSIVVLPVGSIEHHGDYLPLATDLIMADEMSRRVVEGAAADGLDVWRLPPLAYTKSDEHAWAPGTFWIEGEELLATFRSIGRSLAATPARTIVLYNGHGGNVAPMGIALRDLRRRFGLRTFAMNVAVPAGDGDPDGAGGPDEHGLGIHGGWGETSLLMHLRPELVHEEHFTRAIPPGLVEREQIGFAGAPVQFGWLSDDFGFGGVLGDPTGADAAAGSRIASDLVSSGVAALREISTFDPAGGVA
ncbi:creatininase family protein [Demequina sp. NBRC 110055]|uniref:creatininase family protein n=1 Tax=Demequina sp. NBRC 110055 TaxID=1570344 RepID=UPI000A0342EE|nr:creatininase family protein [Demequina sp. NBRC 110055]